MDWSRSGRGGCGGVALLEEMGNENTEFGWWRYTIRCHAEWKVEIGEFFPLAWMDGWVLTDMFQIRSFNNDHPQRLAGPSAVNVDHVRAYNIDIQQI